MQSRRKLLQGLTAGAAGAVLSAAWRGRRVHASGSSSETAGTEVTGPITGGKHGWPFGAYFGDIGKRGYIEEEFFLSGPATRFMPAGNLGPDGRWTVDPAGTVPYKTRILVRRPRNAKAFNGTVVIEWANVSNGYDVSFADPPVIYGGFAYVAVSAQLHGVHGFQTRPSGLVQWDPERYGRLSIPVDSISYDIYTQAARLIGPDRKPAGVDPLGGLRVRKLIAIGGSQSGTRLLTYLNAIQPRENVFDAIMPLVCAGSAAPFDDAPAHPEPAAGEDTTDPRRHSRVIRAKVRDDLSIPVMVLNSETEALFYYSMRQPDTARLVYWEIAGASHGPTGMIALIRQKTDRDGVSGPGDSKVHASDVMWLPTAGAAIWHVHNWVSGGKTPPAQPRIAISGDTPAIDRDAHGNAVGGIRLPELEVPIATYHGLSDTGAIGGQTIPFPPDELKRLYPTHQSYVNKVKAAATAAEHAGVILRYRVREYIEAAQAAPIPV